MSDAFEEKGMRGETMDTVEHETNHTVNSKMTATGTVCSDEAGECDAENIRMRVLILRVTPNRVSTATYNLQEIGLAKALIRRGYPCDVAYYCGKEKGGSKNAFS